MLIDINFFYYYSEGSLNTQFSKKKKKKKNPCNFRQLFPGSGCKGAERTWEDSDESSKKEEMWLEKSDRDWRSFKHLVKSDHKKSHQHKSWICLTLKVHLQTHMM